VSVGCAEQTLHLCVQVLRRALGKRTVRRIDKRRQRPSAAELALIVLWLLQLVPVGDAHSLHEGLNFGHGKSLLNHGLPRRVLRPTSPTVPDAGSA